MTSVDVASQARTRDEIRQAGQRELIARFGDTVARQTGDGCWTARETLDRIWMVVQHRRIGDGQRGTLPRADGPVPGKRDVIAALRFTGEARRDLDLHEFALIEFARSCGATWLELADALDLGSAQAAQQRFQRLSARLVCTPDGGDDDGR